jgi:hypothetical protein
LIYVHIPSRFTGEDPSYLADPLNPNLARDLYAALELRPDSLKLHDEIADAFLRYLEQRRIPVVDMRQVFRRNSGPFYRVEDHHINVDGHRVIGEALVPVIERAELATLR